jgi:MFS family permease
MSPVWMVASLCLAEALGMLTFSTFPALLPTFLDEWGLSATAAGMLSGLFFIGYMLAVPVLTALTDRVDARIVYLWSTVLTFAAAMGFAFLAEGFWSAAPLRVLAGAGLAGTYMPGLKALTDRIEDARLQTRAVSFYTSSFGIGSALSYLFAGEIGARAGWQWAFALPGLGVLLAFAIALAVLRPKPVVRVAAHWLAFLDFRPVLRNREAMGYVLAYSAHNWELFGMRAWIVAFLVFAASLQPGAAEGFWSATAIAALVGFLGMPASIVGNELAIRFGRRRTVSAYMLVSAALCSAIGFAAGQPFLAVVALCLAHGLTVTADSAAITTGAVQAAEAGRKGATMAMHSFLGFGVSFLGALAPGVALDLGGGRDSATAWGFAWLTIAAGALLGPLAILLLTRRRPP